MARVILETITGEIIDELNDKDRIVRATSIEEYKNKVNRYIEKTSDTTEEWKIEHFYKGNIKELSKWIQDLSITERAFLFSIVPYISYDDCHLAYYNRRDIDADDLVEITGMKKSIVYQTISSLIAKDILYKGKNSVNMQYFINPWLFCSGNRINKVLKTMFKNYRVRVMNNVKWGDLQ